MTAQDTTVQDWLMAIRFAISDDSPFRGFVDLSEIFDLPLPQQQAIYDLLTEQERDQLKAVYG